MKGIKKVGFTVFLFANALLQAQQGTIIFNNTSTSGINSIGPHDANKSVRINGEKNVDIVIDEQNQYPDGSFNIYKDNPSGSPLFRVTRDGNVGIGTNNPKSQLVVTSDFGANISGSTGGNAIFGSNLAVLQGGTNHMKLVTPSNHSNNYGYSAMRSSWGKLYFYTNSGNTAAGTVVTPVPRLFIDSNGEVGVGTDSPDAKLTVKGKVHAEEVKVDLSVPAPDYVFTEGYDLKSLEEVQNYIQEHGHLPNIPSAKEMEAKGIELGEMNMKLLEKIEELTLYILSQEDKLLLKDGQIAALYNLVHHQEKRLKKLENLLKANEP